VASDFERRPIAGLSVDDLNLDLARQMTAEAEETDAARWSGEDVIRLLLSRGYLWWDGPAGTPRPTIAGALLFAKRLARATELTQARLQFEACAGDTKEGEPLDAPLVDACLPEAVEHAVAFVRRNTARPQSPRRAGADLAGLHGRARQRHSLDEADHGTRRTAAAPLHGGTRWRDRRTRERGGGGNNSTCDQ
jgi:hypothetical protein